jgi:hypothetical protein
MCNKFLLVLTNPKTLMNLNWVVITSLQKEGRASNAFQFRDVIYEKREPKYPFLYLILIVDDTAREEKLLTLSSPVMPCDIILLILSFICYSLFGLERVNRFQPQKIVAYEGQN